MTKDQLLALKRPGIDNDPDAEPWDGGWNAAIDEVAKLLESRAEPKGYQVYAQRNLVGGGLGMDYPQCVEMVPYGRIYDTRDAALLSVKDKGWMDLWWQVRPVNREPPHK